MKKIIALSLLCGWAMTAPPSKGRNAPLKEWDVPQVFDTAACERSLENTLTRASEANNQHLIPLILSRRCIPMDWIAPDKKS